MQELNAQEVEMVSGGTFLLMYIMLMALKAVSGPYGPFGEY